MSIPTFTLTKKVPLTIFRKTAGSRINGKWVDGVEQEVIIQANVQPLKPYEISLMPEADRTRNWIRVYTANYIQTLKEGEGGHAADEFTWNGERYKMMKVDIWQMGTLDHRKGLAVRFELTPN